LFNLKHYTDVFLKGLRNTNVGDGGMCGDVDKDGKTKNTLSFKGTGLKT
jgi:hypothetical protein